MRKIRGSLEKTINPKTGGEDLLGAIRYAVIELGKTEGIVKGGLFHTLQGSMQQRLVDMGFTNPYLPKLMQQVGILRFHGKYGGTATWQVADEAFLDEMLTEVALEYGLRREERWVGDIDALNAAKKKIEKLEASDGVDPNRRILESAEEDGENVPTDQTVLDGLAEAIAEVETLRQLLGQRDKTIAALTTKLDERGDSNAIANAMIERLRSGKQDV